MSIFADQAEIDARAGQGGDGLTSFLHEKYRDRGGPDGGDGGRGGDIILVADHNLNTLAAFKAKPRLQAEPGQRGGKNKKHGRSGEDIKVKVPVGTVVMENGEVIADLDQVGREVVIAKGGRGGFGNAHFVSSTRQAPRVAEVGEPGERKRLVLELKLVAEVGLIGLPNAGKSTLLSVVSAAKPEIADYPFTTLVPNLGVVDIDGHSVLFADIPGLIEGASQGRGLGDDFLRHIERTAVLLHLIDASGEDIAGSYSTIQHELSSYKVDLTQKPQLVALTKIDALTPERLESQRQLLSTVAGIDIDQVYAISAVAGKGLAILLRAALARVLEHRALAPQKSEPELEVIDSSQVPELWEVKREEDGYRVKGQNIESFALRTNTDSEAGVSRLVDIMRKKGITKELAKLGVKQGDIVRIGQKVLIWP